MLFTSEDIELIQWTRKQYPELSRRELASTVCEFLDWTTDAGRPKTDSCLGFLEKMEAGGMIILPAIQTKSIRSGGESFTQMQEPEVEITGALSDHPSRYYWV